MFARTMIAFGLAVRNMRCGECKLLHLVHRADSNVRVHSGGLSEACPL